MKAGESSAITTTLSEAGRGPHLTVVTPPVQEETDLKLQQTREQLLLLRRQQEELERQKGDLEDLRRKQDEYARGKITAIENLTRGLVLLERAQIEAQRLSELCATTRVSFQDQLEQVQSIRDDQWTALNLRSELAKALGAVENARLEYGRACAKLDCLQPATAAATEPAATTSELGRYFRIGLVASLPLIIAGTIWLLIFLWAR